MSASIIANLNRPQLFWNLFWAFQFFAYARTLINKILICSGRNDDIYSWLLLLLLAFESGIENGADEGMKLHVAFALTGFGVNGRFRVRLRALCGNQLGVEACLPDGELFQEFRARVSGLVCGMDDGDGTVGGIAEAFVMSLLSRCLRMAFEITRVDDVIKFLFAFADNFAVGITELLLAVDCTFSLYCAVEFGERIIQFYVSHIVWLF